MPATGIPMAFHYATGLVMSVGVGLIVLHNTWKILSGRATDAELIQVVESEEADDNEEGKTAVEAEPRDHQH
jgi:TRAP-type C4-dicarboxylate transport system permease small subunit